MMKRLTFALAFGTLLFGGAAVGNPPATQAPMLVAAPPVIATPVSLGSHATAGAASSNAITTGATAPAGSLIVVGVMTASVTTIAVSSITDTNGNTYQLAVSAGWDATGVEDQEIWYTTTTSALTSGSTITVNLSATSNANPWPAVAAYITGIQPSLPKDKNGFTKYIPASGTLASGSTGTLSQANELIIGGLGVYNLTTLTEGSGFTQIVDLDAGGSNHLRAHLAFQIVSATTFINYQPSSSASIFGASMIASFKGF